MGGSGKWTRTVVISGPAEALTDEQIHVVATLRKYFYRRDGYIGSQLLVDKQNGIIRSSGHWATREDLDRSHKNALTLAERIRETIWGGAGSIQIEVSEIYVMDPGEAIEVHGDYVTR